MIYVIFEVIIKEDKMEEYLNLANKLKESLANQEGFIRSERFTSIVNERKLLSLSVWDREESVKSWRNQIDHRLSQKQGRYSILEL